MGLVLAFGIASPGCDKSAVPTCDEVVDHNISIFTGEIQKLMQSSREALIKKCGRMSDRERRCVMDAVTELDLGKCEQDKKRKKPGKDQARENQKKEKKEKEAKEK